jgi:pimeloyl-ACP methyl ester carboxylesterase
VPTGKEPDLTALPNIVLVHGAGADGSTLVAGHSYGGQIITALGTDAPNVVGLVYVAAFGLDEGESIWRPARPDPGGSGPGPPGGRPQRFAWMPEGDFVNHFATDVDPVTARACSRSSSRCTGAPWER